MRNYIHFFESKNMNKFLNNKQKGEKKITHLTNYQVFIIRAHARDRRARARVILLIGAQGRQTQQSCELLCVLSGRFWSCLGGKRKLSLSRRRKADTRKRVRSTERKKPAEGRTGPREADAEPGLQRQRRLYLIGTLSHSKGATETCVTFSNICKQVIEKGADKRTSAPFYPAYHR